MTSIAVYRSSNGDDWMLETDEAGRQTVLHRANRSSGGTETRMPLDEFIERGGGGPEVAAVRQAAGR